jgi:hypothetical protein
MVSPDTASDGLSVSQPRKMKKSKSRKAKHRNRKHFSPSAEEIEDAADDTGTHPTDYPLVSPKSTADTRLLQELEPETFGIYVVSDQSDAESDEVRRPATTHKNSFVAVNSPLPKRPFRRQGPGAGGQEVDRKDVIPPPAQEEAHGVDEELDQQALATGNRQEDTFATSQVNVPSPKENTQGRFMCPFADLYECDKTFVNKKGARRHAMRHLEEDRNPATARSSPSPALIEALEAARAAPDVDPTLKTPAPEVNGEGRFLCPFADVEDCQKTFLNKSGALKHAKSHTSNFVCAVCNKKVGRKDTLDRHMQQHSATEIASAAGPVVDEDAEQLEDEDVYKTPEEAPGEVDLDAGTEDPNVREPSLRRSPSSQEDCEASDDDEPPETHGANNSERLAAKSGEDQVEDESRQGSSAPPSVFDEQENATKDRPMAIENKKRKRGSNALEASRKRTKGSPITPPTSVRPRLETPTESGVSASTRRRQLTEKIVPQLQPRQASMDGWAQKFTPGSNLKHPAFNPSPPRPGTQQISVIVPRTSQAGPSGYNGKAKARNAPIASENVADLHTPLDQRERAGITLRKSSKGKQRADSIRSVDEEDRVSDSDPGLNNMATSVAKRTFPARQDVDQASSDDTESSDVNFTRPPESDSEVERPAKKPRKTKPSTTQQWASKSPEPDMLNSDKRIECIRCHRTFTSQKQLRRHRDNPVAHDDLLKCSGCSDEFYNAMALAKHEREMNHGDGRISRAKGRTGQFTQGEVDRLNKWRDRFCEYHDISTTDFNEMMTATLDRGKDARWPWGFAKRAEFMQEYYDVLPNRNKRSMLRYRERNFQNLEGMRNWTAEDDQHLVRLQAELGSKWAEIGRRLGRTMDAVSQRWRHRLQYGQVETGEWSKDEDKKFGRMLAELLEAQGGKELDESRIPWNKVSEAVGSRSAQQCSNHYRAQHGKKKRGRWIKHEDTEKSVASSRTPSKMEMRLSGQGPRGSAGSQKFLSEKYIHEEDDGDDDEDTADNRVSENPDHPGDPVGEELAHSDESSEDNTQGDSEGEHNPAQAERQRNPLTTKTPAKPLRSSQLFEQTQADTSALKPLQSTVKRKRLQVSQDRPSPDIPIQRQRLQPRSPLGELAILENGQIERDDVDDDDDEEEANSQESQPSSPRSSPMGVRSEANDESEPDDADAPHHEQTLPDDSGDDGESDDDVSDSEIDDAKHDEGEEIDGHDGDQGDGDDDEATPNPAVASDSDDSDSEAGHDNPTGTVSQAPQFQAASSFIDNIHESAKRANIKKVRSGSQSQGQGRLGFSASQRPARRDIWQQGSDEESD